MSEPPLIPEGEDSKAVHVLLESIIEGATDETLSPKENARNLQKALTSNASVFMAKLATKRWFTVHNVRMEYLNAISLISDRSLASLDRLNLALANECHNVKGLNKMLIWVWSKACVGVGDPVDSSASGIFSTLLKNFQSYIDFLETEKAFIGACKERISIWNHDSLASLAPAQPSPLYPSGRVDHRMNRLKFLDLSTYPLLFTRAPCIKRGRYIPANDGDSDTMAPTDCGFLDVTEPTLELLQDDEDEDEGEVEDGDMVDDMGALPSASVSDCIELDRLIASDVGV